MNNFAFISSNNFVKIQLRTILVLFNFFFYFVLKNQTKGNTKLMSNANNVSAKKCTEEKKCTKIKRNDLHFVMCDD